MKFQKLLCALVLLITPMLCFAAAQSHDPMASVLEWVTLIFGLAMIGRFMAQALGQPGVLGELLMGVFFGNIAYFFGMQLIVILREGASIFTVMGHILAKISLQDAATAAIPNPYYSKQVFAVLSSKQGAEYLKVAYIIDILSRYGVVFLLFMVGLETSLKELKHTGRASLQVALIGVIAPISLGFLIALIVMPNATYKAHLFVSATLAATSIGITARVLAQMNKLKTREARTILGAAMIDDILGLVLLAIVSSIVVSGGVDFHQISTLIATTVVFFLGVLLIGPIILPKIIVGARFFLTATETKLVVSFGFVMLVAWLATLVQLAAIIGAFAAGMILNDELFKNSKIREETLSIKELTTPFETILAPLFFMVIGIQVKLETFFDWQVLLMATGLIIAGIIGKLLSGLGASRRDDRLLIGIGMLPRGEVGLVFAAIGRTLGVMSDQLFSAIILMVIVTTVITPPLLKRRFSKAVESV